MTSKHQKQLKAFINWASNLSTGNLTINPEDKTSIEAAAQEINKILNPPASVAEAAKVLNLSTRRIQQMVDNKELKAERAVNMAGHGAWEIDRDNLLQVASQLSANPRKPGPKKSLASSTKSTK